MNSKRSSFLDVRRIGALLLAVAQLGAAGIQGVDAVMDSERTALPTHIESEQADDCHVEHDHLFCQVVRSLGTVALSDATPAPMGLQAITVDRRLAVQDLALSGGAADEEALPRAPPIA